MVAESQRHKRLITISKAFDDLPNDKSFQEDSLIQYICVQFSTSIRTAREYLKELSLLNVIFEHDGHWERNKAVKYGTN